MKRDFFSIRKALMALSLICSMSLHLVYLVVQPPKKYPFLFEALIMILCFSQFLIMVIHTNIKQWRLETPSRISKSRKNI